MITYCIGNINPGQVRSTYMSSVIDTMADRSRPDLQFKGLLQKNDSGPYLDVMRNHVVGHFLEQTDADVLVFVDSDMVFRPTDIHQLLDSFDVEGVDVMGGWYTSFYPEQGEFRPVAYEWFGDRMRPIPNPPFDRTPFNVDAVGTGFMAIGRKILKRLEKRYGSPMPWFAEEIVDGCQLGEDLTFCHRVEMSGGIVMFDPQIRVGHEKPMLLDPNVQHAGQQSAVDPEKLARLRDLDAQFSQTTKTHPGIAINDSIASPSTPIPFTHPSLLQEQK